jgi:lipopolysaccharide export system protein LptC
LSLSNAIRIVTDTGYTLLLDSAAVDMGKGDIVSQTPVTVEMQSGKIEANSMNASNNGASIVFSGGVKSTFTGVFGAQNGSEKQPSNPSSSNASGSTQ